MVYLDSKIRSRYRPLNSPHYNCLVTDCVQSPTIYLLVVSFGLVIAYFRNADSLRWLEVVVTSKLIIPAGPS